jgi:hypothetical protein
MFSHETTSHAAVYKQQQNFQGSSCLLGAGHNGFHAVFVMGVEAKGKGKGKESN